ncbi:Fur family transcriptional regulator [Dyella sp.]|uniref:Fur family transcriptional regulator n=1 Tax=Dyella sp. TaxID=1869338 RepID=UPI0039C880F7
MKASRGKKRRFISSASDQEGTPLSASRTAFGHIDPQSALREVSAICRDHGVQFTELRQRLLLTLWASSVPMTAYELLHRLEETWARTLVPMTVYRALSGLLNVNLIARIESHNAYVSRSTRSHPNASVFLICTQCKSTIEIQDVFVEERVNESAGRVGFQVQRSALEIHGKCARCLGGTKLDLGAP